MKKSYLAKSFARKKSIKKYYEKIFCQVCNCWYSTNYLTETYSISLKSMMYDHYDNLSLQMNVRKAEETLKHGPFFFVFQRIATQASCSCLNLCSLRHLQHDVTQVPNLAGSWSISKFFHFALIWLFCIYSLLWVQFWFNFVVCSSEKLGKTCDFFSVYNWQKWFYWETCKATTLIPKVTTLQATVLD